jgi:hypothetical protein
MQLTDYGPFGLYNSQLNIDKMHGTILPRENDNKIVINELVENNEPITKEKNYDKTFIGGNSPRTYCCRNARILLRGHEQNKRGLPRRRLWRPLFP